MSWLDLASVCYAVDRDDELAVEMEPKALLEGAPLAGTDSLHDELAGLTRQIQDRLAPQDNGRRPARSRSSRRSSSCSW